MLDKLKADFDGILELVNKAPQPLQEVAFRIILEHWFVANIAPPRRPPAPAPTAEIPPDATPPAAGVPSAVKPFLTANAITTQIFEKVFHPAGPGAQLLVSDIPGNGKASKMINLSLLLCVKEALESGTFRCTMNALREMSVHYDCYDSTNFSTTLKANKNYYRPRNKGEDIELSGPGLKKAGDIIKAVAAEA